MIKSLISLLCFLLVHFFLLLAPMTDTLHPRVHPSIPSHLGTELATLRLLQRRSAPQHRSAIFLRHVDHVVRTGRRVAFEVIIGQGALEQSNSLMARRVQKVNLILALSAGH
jgi:hypothetical protein